MSCMRFFSVRLTNALTWICLTLGISSNAFAAEPVNLTISTGSVSGVYYPAGGALCRLLNKSQKQHQLHCSVTTSEGSIANIQKLRNNEVPLAIVQSDIEQHAFTGLSEFQPTGAMPQLRALFSLYTEAFTLVVRQDSNVLQLPNLIGKRIDIGNPGSGERATMELLMQQLNWKLTDFPLVTGLHADERAQALCDNQIDAFVFVAGHPNGAIREASTSCDVKLISLPPAQIAEISKTHPEYTATTIAGGLYRGNDSDIATLGVTATLLTTDKLDDETAYQIVKATMENLNQFERSHPALKGLNAQTMAHTGGTIPLHPGAIRYYREHNIPM
jgi:TRAP transporter TAXI family solute receptor